MARRRDPVLDTLAKEKWCALDTETTGLGPYDQVIEVAAVGADGEVWIDTRVAVDRPVPAKATAVHGLSGPDLADAPSWPVVWQRLHLFLHSAVMVAWNAAFDIRLLRQTCDRHRVAFQAPAVVCLREAFRRRHPLVRSSLGAACLTLGVPLRPRHRARSDAELTRRLAFCLMEENGSLITES